MPTWTPKERYSYSRDCQKGTPNYGNPSYSRYLDDGILGETFDSSGTKEKGVLGPGRESRVTG